MSDVNVKDKEEIARMIQDQMFKKCCTEVQFDNQPSSGSGEYMNWRSSEYRNQKSTTSESSVQSAGTARRYFLSVYRYYQQPTDNDSSQVTSWRAQPNVNNWRIRPGNSESTSKTNNTHENQRKSNQRSAGVTKKDKKGQRVDSQGFTMIGKKRKVPQTSPFGMSLDATNLNKFSILDTE